MSVKSRKRVYNYTIKPINFKQIIYLKTQKKAYGNERDDVCTALSNLTF